MRKGAKPHLKRGAWAVSLGSEMWAFNLVVSHWNEAAANEPVWTKVSSKWVSMKSKQARWQIANKRTSSSVDGDSVHEYSQCLSRVVEVRVFVFETLTACRCSFQRQSTHSARHFLAGIECWAPRVFVWILFCMPSVYACLIPIPLFLCCLSALYSSQNACKSSKTYSSLTKSAGQFFHSRKETGL